MFTSDIDENFLRGALERGEVVLVLGAGASASSENRDGDPVKLARALAEAVADLASMPYANETLTEVLGAVEGSLVSRQRIDELLVHEYAKVTGCADLERLFDFTWRRIYTWNYDDGLENLRNSGVQRRRIFNGMIDPASIDDDITHLQTIYLHGQITKIEHGLILTETEYNKVIAGEKHNWYRQLAVDYVKWTPVFIGSKLNEPILSLELERARKNRDNGLGKAYVIIPDELSAIQTASLASRNIVHLKGTLSDFAQWVSKGQPGKYTPRQSMKKGLSFASVLANDQTIGQQDLDTARPIFQVSWTSASGDASALDVVVKDKLAREFLEGSPPTWTLAASDVPVWLKRTDDLLNAARLASLDAQRLFVVTGQSGSGKTMALMQALLRLSREDPKFILYDLRGEVKSLRAALNLIQRLHPDEHVNVYIGDIFVYGDSLAEDAMSTRPGGITIFSSARSGEWKQHWARRVGEYASTFPYERFQEDDHRGLIEKLTQYVPAPRFRKLRTEEQLERLSRSKHQLLIALRDATRSKKFSAAIAGEFMGLPHRDSRYLVLIAGMPTLARTGISRAMAREVYEASEPELTFEEAMIPLEGIITPAPNERLMVRHELYVRHIIENVSDFSDVIQASKGTLRTYTKFSPPIVKSVGRYDALLFKFLLNHNFIYELANRRGMVAEAISIYSEFEVDFVLDGHFWLQFGQYLVEWGDLDRALAVLQKSIEAYPENSYAWHSLADVQLRVAARRPAYDATTVELIGDAVKTLMEQDESPNLQTDEYAIVTLAHNHIAALVAHGQAKQAANYAQRYFDRLQLLERRNSEPALTVAKDRLFKYLASGEWNGANPGRNTSRNRRTQARPPKR